MVSFLGSETEPSSGSSSPTTIRKSVVLPEPLGPTKPTFSPGFNWKDASTKTNCLPYCLLIFAKEIMGRERGLNFQVSRGSKSGLGGKLASGAAGDQLLVSVGWQFRTDQRLHLTPNHGIAFNLDMRRHEHLRVPGKPLAVDVFGLIIHSIISQNLGSRTIGGLDLAAPMKQAI